MFSQGGGLQMRRPYRLQAVDIGLGRLLKRVLDTELEKEHIREQCCGVALWYSHKRSGTWLPVIPGTVVAGEEMATAKMNFPPISPS